MDQLSTTSVWAVGTTATKVAGEGNIDNEPLIEHRNGTRWSIVTGADPARGATGDLTASAAPAQRPVGRRLHPVGRRRQEQVLFEHFDGNILAQAPFPTQAAPAPGRERLLPRSRGGVGDLGRNVWVVGTVREPNPTGQLHRPLERQGLERVPALPQGPDVESPAALTSVDLNQLTGVTVVSAKDAWASGSEGNVNNQNFNIPYVLHWNGTKWALVKTPNRAARAACSTASPRWHQDIWAVGQTQQLNGAIAPLTEQFNGTAWKVVTSPAPGSKGRTPDDSLDGVASPGHGLSFRGGRPRYPRPVLPAHPRAQDHARLAAEPLAVRHRPGRPAGPVTRVPLRKRPACRHRAAGNSRRSIYQACSPLDCDMTACAAMSPESRFGTLAVSRWSQQPGTRSRRQDGNDGGRPPRRTLAARAGGPGSLPLTGRSPELAVLDRCLDAADPPASVVLITGPGGIGKSTLLRETARRAHDRGFSVVSVDGRELGPAPEMLEAALRDAAGHRPLVLLDSDQRMTALGPVPAPRAIARPARPGHGGHRGPGDSDPGWFAGGWEALTVRLDLARSARGRRVHLLAAHGLSDARVPDIVDWAAGLPLALALAADAAPDAGLERRHRARPARHHQVAAAPAGRDRTARHPPVGAGYRGRGPDHHPRSAARPCCRGGRRDRPTGSCPS